MSPSYHLKQLRFVLNALVTNYIPKDIDTYELAILSKIASLVDDDGYAFVPQKQLAAMCKMSRVTCQRKIASLLDKRLIKIVRHGNKVECMANIYTFNIELFLTNTPDYVENMWNTCVDKMTSPQTPISHRYPIYTNKYLDLNTKSNYNNKQEEVFNKNLAKEEKPKPLTLEKDMTRPPHLGDHWEKRAAQPIGNAIESALKGLQEQKVQETAQSSHKQQESLYGPNQPLNGEVAPQPGDTIDNRVTIGVLAKLTKSIHEATVRRDAGVEKLYGNADNVKPVDWGK